MLPALGLLTIVGTSSAIVLNDAASPAQGDSSDVIAAALSSNGGVSRSAERAPLPNEAAADKMVDGHMYVKASDAVDVFADSDDTSPVLATLAPRDKVAVTGEKKRGWTEIVHNDVPRWVPAAGLTDSKPKPPKKPEPAIGTSPCPDGVSDESGLQPDTVRVLRAVCAKFPSITTIGGARAGGDHGAGLALDIMVDPGTGNQVAAFLQENQAKLGIEYLIWQQRIWRPATSGSWRGMSDRGSPTANHMDHVHANT